MSRGVMQNSQKSKSMKSVKPDELISHRVFFTEFDRYNTIFHWENNKSDIERLLERKLKLLILTKGHVVVAASQLLESPFAHNFILKHPSLLKSGALISSMKYGHDSTLDFLIDKREEQRNDSKNPYHTKIAEEVADTIDDIGTCVRWTLEANSTWFRDRLALDLDDPKSLIRATLRHQNVIIPKDFSKLIKECDFLSRGKVESIAKSYGSPDLETIVNTYADFIYYVSGARTTKSEGVLPQENLVDFSISDLLGKKTKLSDSEIFFKIFIDTVKAKTSTIFPMDFLDSISIENAIELRQIAIAKNFIDKYNMIQIKTKEALQIHDSERLVLLMSELEQFESELYFEFSKTLDKELPTRVREKKQRATGKVLHSLASLIIPFYSPESYKELIVSGLTIAGKDQTSKTLENKINKGLTACESVLENMNILDRQILLDFVDEMKKKYASKMFGQQDRITN
jgi:predicted XRE-type DNA-binding protein